MEELNDKHLGRLRLGLLALVAGLIFDAVDFRAGEIDVLHDGVAAVALLVAGWAVGESVGASKAAPKALFWVAGVGVALGQVVDLVGPGWATHRGFQIARFALYAGGLALFAMGMVRFTKGVGLSSSVRWRRSGLQMALLVLLPGIFLAVFIMAPAQGLPFRHTVGSLDGAWWKTAIGYATMVAGLLAAFDTGMAAVTTWRSAGRRT